MIAVRELIQIYGGDVNAAERAACKMRRRSPLLR